MLLFSLLGLTNNNSEVKAAGPLIVIDPGHGGVDPGAIGNGLYEKTLNLQLATKVKKYLEPFTSNVIMTRTTDMSLGLKQRTDYANSLNADLFVSIHHDSSVSKSVKGISTHYSTYRPGLNMQDAYVQYNGKNYPFIKEDEPSRNVYFKDGSKTRSVRINYLKVVDPTPLDVAKKSKTLSDMMANNIANLGYNRMYTSTGSRDYDLYVTRWTKMPSILIENGFISNPIEAAKISNPLTQELHAKTIADTIVRYFGANTQTKMQDVVTDKQSPQSTGTNITLEAEATGFNLVYKFHVFDGKEWTVLRDYSSSNKLTWRPDKSDKYKFSVHVKNKNSTKEYDDYKAFEYVVYDPVEVESVTTSKTSPQNVNEPIEITTNATGGTKLLYKFHVFNGTEWMDLTDFTQNNSITWQPNAPGEYKFSIHVKDETSQKAYDTYAVLYYEINDENSILTSDKMSPQEVNTSILLTGKAEANTLYKFVSIKDGQTQILQDFSSSNEYTWTPVAGGDYNLILYTKVQGSTNEYDAIEEIQYKITVDPVKAEKVRADKASPQKINETIKLMVEATGGTEKLYKFHVYDGNTWTDLTEYIPSNTFDWTPTKPGDYKFSVHVKDKESSNQYDDFVTLLYKIKVDPIKVESITSDVRAPQLEGTDVTFTANATGGMEKLYKFHLYDGKKWTVLQDYSPSNSLTWKATAGNNKVVVHVKEKGSKNEYDAYTYTWYTIKDNPVRAISLTPSSVSPQFEGTDVTFTANATGGVEKLYKFHVFDGKVWSVLRDYNTSNKLTWKPSAGQYKVVVHVKDRNSQKEYDSYTYTMFTVRNRPVNMVDVQTNYQSPQAANSTITMTALAEGGSQKLYKFHAFDGKKWYDLTDFTTSNVYNWTPTKAGTYKISVHVKDKDSRNKYDDYIAFEYEVVVPADMIDVTHQQTADNQVTITANATGGTQPVYKFWVFDGNDWTVLQDYSPAKTYAWSPQPGQYKISVHVKDIHSSKEYDDFGAFTIDIE